jgi:hypothetical protein
MLVNDCDYVGGDQIELTKIMNETNAHKYKGKFDPHA